MKNYKLTVAHALLFALCIFGNNKSFAHDEPAVSPQIRQIDFTEFSLKFSTTDNKKKTYQFRESFEVTIPEGQDIEINVLFPANVSKKNELLKLFRWDPSHLTWVFEKSIKIGKETIDGQNFRTINFSKSGIYAVFEDFKTHSQTTVHSILSKHLVAGSIVQKNIKVKVSQQALNPTRKLVFSTHSLSILSEITLEVLPDKNDNPVEIHFKMGELKPWQIRETKKGNLHIILRKKDIERFVVSHNAS
jgi:hypothetical protein